MKLFVCGVYPAERTHMCSALRFSVHKMKDCLCFQKFVIDLNKDTVADTFLTNSDK